MVEDNRVVPMVRPPGLSYCERSRSPVGPAKPPPGGDEALVVTLYWGGKFRKRFAVWLWSGRVHADFSGIVRRGGNQCQNSKSPGRVFR